MRTHIRLYLFIFSFIMTSVFPSPCFALFNGELSSFFSSILARFTLINPSIHQKQYSFNNKRDLRDLPFAKIIAKAAELNNLDPCLLHAIIINESNYRKTAISPCGARGLMQLMPETARELAVKNSFDPQENVAGGAQYYRKLLNEFGDHYTALLAYNSGPGNVRKGKRYKESERYAKKVISTWNSLYQQYFTR